MKKFVAPLQALAALFLCSGMAWLIFVLTSINPTPPTLTDLQARNTQDLSFVNMNSTAVALAKQMLADMAPSPAGPIFLPVTGRETFTPTPSAIVTLKSVSTVVNTPTPIRFFVSPTATHKKRDQDTAVPPTSTLAPTATAASVPTNTNLPPLTPTKPPTVFPSNTAATKPTVPPTSVPTTPVPTNTEPPSTEPPATESPAVTQSSALTAPPTQPAP